MPPAPPPGGDQPGGPQPFGQHPFGSTPIPPSDSGPYQPGPYPAAGPYPAGPYPLGPFGATGSPPGYAAYGQPGGGTPSWSGLSIAGFVLALIGLLPCFWFWFQVPGVLGVIFCLVGLGATKHGAKRGRGLAIAGLVIGSVAVLITAGFTLFLYNSNDCTTDGLQIDCHFNDGTTP